MKNSKVIIILLIVIVVLLLVAIVYMLDKKELGIKVPNALNIQAGGVIVGEAKYRTGLWQYPKDEQDTHSVINTITSNKITIQNIQNLLKNEPYVKLDKAANVVLDNMQKEYIKDITSVVVTAYNDSMAITSKEVSLENNLIKLDLTDVDIEDNAYVEITINFLHNSFLKYDFKIEK